MTVTVDSLLKKIYMHISLLHRILPYEDVILHCFDRTFDTNTLTGRKIKPMIQKY